MRTLLDTSIAIELANGDGRAIERVAQLDSLPLLSVMFRVELEGGLYTGAVAVEEHRARLDALLEQVEELSFTSADAVAYAGIVSRLGFSRRVVIDRMIAAQAIAADAVLATLNPRDFRGVPDLQVEDWTA